MSYLSLQPSPNLASIALGQRQESLIHNIFLLITASLLIAISAQIVIRLPFTPVPITGQTFAILLLGMALGAKRATLAVVAYLIEGAMGLPVFANFGGGLGYFFGPTAGYLFGFIPAAFVVGKLAEQGWDRNPITTALAMLIGNALIYIPGVLVLSIMLAKPISETLAFGFLPFLTGDLIKLVLAALIMPITWRLISKK